jgi:hypothetical protein
VSTAEAFSALRSLPPDWYVDIDGSLADLPTPAAIDAAEAWLTASGLDIADDDINADAMGGVGLEWSKDGRRVWLAFGNNSEPLAICSNDALSWFLRLAEATPDDIRRWLDHAAVPMAARVTER